MIGSTFDHRVHLVVRNFSLEVFQIGQTEILSVVPCIVAGWNARSNLQAEVLFRFCLSTQRSSFTQCMVPHTLSERRRLQSWTVSTLVAVESRSAMKFLPGAWLVVLTWTAMPHEGMVAQDTVTEGTESKTSRPPIESFLALLNDPPSQRTKTLQGIVEQWNVGDTGLLLESARFAQDRGTHAAILGLLSERTGQTFRDTDSWYRWLWNQDIELHPNYASFKQELYRRIDPRFAEYFSDNFKAEIRLDEIRWGGVRRDGIPPLDRPETISAGEATFLNDSDVVFGVRFGGQSRAYPKRILAWHEMVKDNVGGLSINGVYCTLCGSMIVYETHIGDKHYELGTSGFLYRSNKLMYDHETKSMWSTVNGKPVVGPLVEKGIQLKTRYVVTTTWGHWKADHPDTDVLSLKTGHRRDYGEGVAYKDYFATDELMFTVPKVDKRLKNKDEVLIVRATDEPVAISANFLAQNPVYHYRMDEVSFVVITDSSGANRVYESSGTEFSQVTNDHLVIAKDGTRWTATEEALVSEDGKQQRIRLPAHRAFWFGWFAANPDVRLVK